MDILDDIGVSKLSAKVFLKVNYTFKPRLTLCSQLGLVVCEWNDILSHIAVLHTL